MWRVEPSGLRCQYTDMLSIGWHLGAALAALTVSSAIANTQVTTAQYGNSRTGAVTNEVALTPRNVNPATFGRIGRFEVDGDVYAQPLYLRSLEFANGVRRDVLFVATEHGSVYAFDARSPGSSPIWKESLIDPSVDITPVAARDARCPFIQPEVGITSTPVIDPDAGILYVLMRTREPTASGEHRFVQRLHALNIQTGRDRIPPAEIRASVRGTGDGARAGIVSFDQLRENPRAALLLTHGAVYLAWASSCDVGPYHGWVIAYDAKTLRQLGAFNATPTGAEGGIWQGDAGLAADSAGNVYAVTGNGTFTEESSAANYGNTVLELGLTRSGLVVRDYFTPYNQLELSSEDQDLGSSGAVLIDERGSHPHMILVTGKEGVSYLIDRDRMGHYRSDKDAHALQTVKSSTGGFGAVAFWNHTVYVWGSNDVIKSYRVSGGRLSSPVEGKARSVDPGATPTVSANGDHDGIVWAIETRTWRGADKPAVLHAFDAADVRRELYNSEMNSRRDRAGTALRFAIPTVVAGRVYVGVKRGVDVYGLITQRR